MLLARSSLPKTKPPNSPSGGILLELTSLFQIPDATQNPGAPSPGFPGELGGVDKVHAAFLKRKPHTPPFLMPRGRKSGSFAPFAKLGIHRPFLTLSTN
jgi:hypothetical protein